MLIHMIFFFFYLGTHKHANSRKNYSYIWASMEETASMLCHLWNCQYIFSSLNPIAHFSQFLFPYNFESYSLQILQFLFILTIIWWAFFVVVIVENWRAETSTCPSPSHEFLVLIWSLKPHVLSQAPVQHFSCWIKGRFRLELSASPSHCVIKHHVLPPSPPQKTIFHSI